MFLEYQSGLHRVNHGLAAAGLLNAHTYYILCVAGLLGPRDGGLAYAEPLRARPPPAMSQSGVSGRILRLAGWVRHCAPSIQSAYRGVTSVPARWTAEFQALL